MCTACKVVPLPGLKWWSCHDAAAWSQENEDDWYFAMAKTYAGGHKRPRGRVPVANGRRCTWDADAGCWRTSSGEVHVHLPRATRRSRASSKKDEDSDDEEDSDDDDGDDGDEDSDDEEDSDDDGDESDGMWVQCDSCKKWRRLPRGGLDDEDAPWDCSLNKDAQYNACAQPEEVWEEPPPPAPAKPPAPSRRSTRNRGTATAAAAAAAAQQLVARRRQSLALATLPGYAARSLLAQVRGTAAAAPRACGDAAAGGVAWRLEPRVRLEPRAVRLQGYARTTCHGPAAAFNRRPRRR